MAAFKMVSRKITAYVNGREAEGTLRIRKYAVKPKSVGRPLAREHRNQPPFKK
jgi:hypothetical protein